jgi:hypothetical protein
MAKRAEEVTKAWRSSLQPGERVSQALSAGCNPELGLHAVAASPVQVGWLADEGGRKERTKGGSEPFFFVLFTPPSLSLQPCHVALLSIFSTNYVELRKFSREKNDRKSDEGAT